jgi:hypothetical protein
MHRDCISLLSYPGVLRLSLISNRISKPVSQKQGFELHLEDISAPMMIKTEFVDVVPVVVGGLLATPLVHS